MQGLLFLILNQEGTPLNHGIIVEKLTGEKYLCQFQKPPVSNRVVSIEEIQGFNLFSTQEQFDNFLNSVQKSRATTSKTSIEKPPSTNDTAAKAAAKRVAKKKITKKRAARPAKSLRRKSSKKPNQ